MIKGLLEITKERGIPPAGKAVELGCGQGQLSVIFAKLGYYVEAVDDSPQAVEDTLFLKQRHRDEIEEAKGGVSGLHCDIRRYPFYLKPYDLLSSQGVIHYIPNDDTKLLIKRMQAATAIGGLNAITTWIDRPQPTVPCHSEVTLYPDEHDTVASLYSSSRGWNPLMIIYDLNKLDISHPEGEEQAHRHSYLKIIAEKISETEDVIPWEGSHELVLPAESK